MDVVERSCFTFDLGAVRRNAETLLRAAGGAELWAVVKAEGYGHGAVDVSKAALEAGASALCVATLPEALHLRAALRNARIVVMGPVSEREVGEARAARLELVAADGPVPEGVRVHIKVDTGMGRRGPTELPAPGPNSHVEFPRRNEGVVQGPPHVPPHGCPLGRACGRPPGPMCAGTAPSASARRRSPIGRPSASARLCSQLARGRRQRSWEPCSYLSNRHPD